MIVSLQIDEFDGVFTGICKVRRQPGKNGDYAVRSTDRAKVRQALADLAVVVDGDGPKPPVFTDLDQ